MQTDKEKKSPISPHIDDIYAYMKKRVGLEKSYDLGYRRQSS